MSLCAAVVLLGTPRGQNFVAEAADEATKSVALLTLTLTDEEDEPIKADMTWKTFISGADTVFEVAFRLSDGSLVGTIDSRSCSPGSRVRSPSWAATWLDTVAVDGVTLSCVPSWGIGVRIFSLTAVELSFGLYGLSTSAGSRVPPLCLAVGDVSVAVRGLWTAYVGDLLVLSGADLPAANGCTITSDNPAVVEVLPSGDLHAVSAGTATVSWTDDSGVCQLLCTVADTPDTTPDTAGYLEATVDVKGQQQRLRVYNPNNVDLTGAQLVAEAVTAHENLDDTHPIEHLLSYNISLLDANGTPLKMPLSAPVELCFEVLDGLDQDELEVVLAQQFADGEFEEELVEIDGATWVKVKTDHFSPYALIDKLTDAEKGVQVQDDPGPENNVKTGDSATRVAVAGLGMTLVLALGVMLRLITSKRKFEE